MIVLKKLEDDVKVTMILKQECSTWSEVTEKFINFLQASGYIVQGIDVAEYLQDMYAFQARKDEEVESIIELEHQLKKKKRRKKNAKQK